MSNLSSPSQPAASNAIFTSDFVETIEYKRFVEFCEASRHYQYIGLCFGAAGTGKTVSARRYSRVAEVERYASPTADPRYGQPLDTVFYTPEVINTPAVVARELSNKRGVIRDIALGPLRREANEALEVARLQDEWEEMKYRKKLREEDHPGPPPQERRWQVRSYYDERLKSIGDPTRLILIDEADRLKISSLEQVRAHYDTGGVGVVLIGMPGIEKRLSRYPQLYSRIGFVHEFRPLGLDQLTRLFERHWSPAGVQLPAAGPDAETVAAILRVTRGNFRLLSRLLAQVERILAVNELTFITRDVIEAARQSLVIGAA